MNWKKRELNRKPGTRFISTKEENLLSRTVLFTTASEKAELKEYCKKNKISVNEFLRTLIGNHLL